MALNTIRANRIFEKLGFPSVRAANHFEQSVDEYGTKLQWVIGTGPYQVLKAYPTLAAVIAANLEQHWDIFDREKLTAIELRELRMIPSQVAAHI